MNPIFYALAAYFWWGFAPLFWSLLEGVQPLSLIALRVLFSWPLLVTLVIIRRSVSGWLAPWRDRRLVGRHLVAAALLSMNWLSFVWAVLAGRVLEVSFAFFLCPLMTVALGALLEGDRLSPVRWVAVGSAGVGVIAMGYSAATFPIAGLVMASTWAVYSLFKRRTTLGALSGLCVEVTWLLVPAIVVLLFRGPGLGSFALRVGDAQAWGWIAASGLITTIPLLLYAEAAKGVRLSTLGVMQYMVPSCNFLLATFYYREPFGLGEQIAFCAIWLGLILYGLGGIPRKARKGPPEASVSRSAST